MSWHLHGHGRSCASMHYAIVTETYPPEVNGVALTVQSLEKWTARTRSSRRCDPSATVHRNSHTAPTNPRAWRTVAALSGFAFRIAGRSHARFSVAPAATRCDLRRCGWCLGRACSVDARCTQPATTACSIGSGRINTHPQRASASPIHGPAYPAHACRARRCPYAPNRSRTNPPCG